MIGDKDPEDAYSADDPPGSRLRVLERVVDDLRAAPHPYRRDDALRLVVNMEPDRLTRTERARLHAIRDALEAL